MKILLVVVAAGAFAGRVSAAPTWEAWERRSLEIESEVLRPLAKAWRTRREPSLKEVLAEGSMLCDFSLPAKPSDSFDGIRRFRRSARMVPARSAIRKYLAEMSTVDDVSLTLLDVSPDGSSAEIQMDLRARTPDGSRRTDRGRATATLRSVGGKTKLAALACPELETLIAARAMFEDATEASGLNAVPVLPREEAIRRGGYALAVSDYDGDGWPDVYVGGRAPGRLLRNLQGRFVDATQAAGLGRDTMAKAALFADLDSDGRLDLVVQRFVDDEREELMFYRNGGGGRFENARPQVRRLRKHDRPMGLAAADFNDDGRLDLYVGYPGVRDFTDSAIDAQAPLSRQAVYLNRGGWVFEEAPESSRPESAIYGALVRPHSALGLDLDRDGRQDLLVIDDRGSPTRFYLNSSGGRFSEAQNRSGLRNAGWGMTAAAGDFAGDGRDAIYFSNVDFSAGHRIVRFVERAGGPQANAPGFERIKDTLRGNRLYRSRSDGIGDIAFDEVTEKAGVGWAGEAPAGAVWVDYNADGRPDLYVTNGLWSADPDRDADSEFIRGQLSEARPQGIEDPNRVMRGLQESGASLGGYQRNRLFRNDGGGGFTEVGYVVGADRIEDGYVAATGDFDRDGRVDLLLRNADPATLKRPFPPLTLLLNRGPAGRTLALSLRGRDGAASFGALVTANFPGRREGRQLRSVEGAVQSEPVLYIGMGDAPIADIEVLWPSGTLDRVKGAGPGRLSIAEGRGKVPPATGADRACLESFDPERRLGDMEMLASMKGGTESMDAIYFGLYTAIGRRDPGACAVARPFRHDLGNGPGNPRSMTGEWLCKSYYHQMSYFSSFIFQGPDFDRACGDFMRFEVPSTTPEEAGKMCAVTAANRADPAALCAKQVAARYRNPRELKDCELDFRALNGDSSACDRFVWTSGQRAPDQPRLLHRCHAFAALSRAHKAGDPALCADLDVCRALAGQAAGQAERYRLRLASAYCSADRDSTAMH